MNQLNQDKIQLISLSKYLLQAMLSNKRLQQHTTIQHLIKMDHKKLKEIPYNRNTQALTIHQLLLIAREPSYS